MKSKGEIVLLGAVLCFIFAIAMMIPQARHWVFGGGGGGAGTKTALRALRPTGPAIVETPRNQFPMAQYTVPQLFKKMKFPIEDDGARRYVYFYWYGPPPP